MAAAHEDPKETVKAFHEAVNMTPSELRRWLDSEESQSVGMTHEGEKVTEAGGAEAVGPAYPAAQIHQAGRPDRR